MKKNVNILKEYQNWIVKLHSNYIFFDLYTKNKKDQFIRLIANIRKSYKNRKLNNILKNNINKIILKYNIKLFDDRWIINNIDIFNKNENIKDILFPISFKWDILNKLNKIINKDLFDMNDDDQSLLNSLNFQLSEVYLDWAYEVLDLLIKELKNEYNKFYDILKTYRKNDNSLFLFIERWRYFYWYIFKSKLYIFNIFLKWNNILINNDYIYQDKIYNKTFFDKKIEYYQVSHINKTLIEYTLIKNYNIKINDIDKNIIINKITKQNIIKEFCFVV